MNLSETCTFLRLLLKNTFTRGGPYKKEMERIQYNLYTRAWIVHIIYNANRIIYAILGIAAWQKAYEERDKIENLNEELIDKIEATT